MGVKSTEATPAGAGGGGENFLLGSSLQKVVATDFVDERAAEVREQILQDNDLEVPESGGSGSTVKKGGGQNKQGKEESKCLAAQRSNEKDVEKLRAQEANVMNAEWQVCLVARRSNEK